MTKGESTHIKKPSHGHRKKIAPHMPYTAPTETDLVIISKDELTGGAFAVRFETSRNEVYVSPAVMRLVEEKADFEKLRHSLHVRLYRGSPRDIVFRNIKEEIKKDAQLKKRGGPPNHGRLLP